MARAVFALLLVAIVALASAQSIVDDFLTPTRSFFVDGPTDNEDRTTVNTVPNTIQGGEREIYIESDNGNLPGFTCTEFDNQPQSAVNNGIWSIAQGTVCQADFELRLDGSQGAADNAATRGFGLGLNLDAAATGMTFSVFCDHACDFEVEIASSGSAVSSFQGSVTGSEADQSIIKGFSISWSDFSGNADFSNVGSISFKFPAEFEVDAEVSNWRYITPLGSITGQIFEDCNCNQVQDTGDDAISNVIVSYSGASSGSVSTDSNGFYSITNLPSGSYTLTVSSITHCDISGNSKSTTVSTGNSVVNFYAQVDADTITCPADVQTNCRATTTATTGSASVVSTCGSGTSTEVPSFTDSSSSVTCTGRGAQISTITRTFTSTAGSCSQTISVFDDESIPVITTPADITNADEDLCANPLPSVTGQATAGGSCTPATTSFTDVDNSQCVLADCAFSRTITRTWTAVDECGNTAVATVQRISCGSTSECPPCTVTVPSVPSVSVPTVPTVNPPTRNCRLICDDDDSSASILSASVMVFVALIALLF